MPPKEALTAERLREVLDYDPDTGIFTWKVRPARNVRCGAVAGSRIHNWYSFISIDNRSYMAHRLAWLHTHGELPESFIDHINRDKSDNRMCNLRLATPSQNGANRKLGKNNTSGIRGVYWNQSRGKWQAQIGDNGKKTCLGYFTTKDDAARAYRTAADKTFGKYLSVD